VLQRKSAPGVPLAVLLLAGCLLPLGCAELPSAPAAATGTALAVLCIALRRLRPLALLPVGALLMWDAAGDVLDARLDPALAGADLRGRFRVVDFPVPAGESLRLLLSPEDRPDLPTRIRVSWYDAPAIPGIGDCWELELRLRRPRGYANPAGFDYEGWLFRERIGATGYVRRGLSGVDCDSPDRLASVRRRLEARLAAALPAGDATAALAAITVGARHGISREQWDRYAVTGTSHLMAISGLHVGLAAAVAFALFRVALAPARGGNARDRAMLAAASVAGLYVSMSGFAVPARRALGMLLCALLAQRMRRRLVPRHVLGMVAAGVAVADPPDILAPGFQLSFAAVAILLACGARRGAAAASRQGSLSSVRRLIRDLPGLQLALLLGLLPLTVLHFDRVSWVAPAVNLVVVPVFNLLTVPAALLGVLLDGPLAGAGQWALRVAWFSMDMVLRLVARAAALPGTDLPVAARNGIAVVLPWFALAWVVLPPGWPGRRVAWLAAVATMCYLPPATPDTCVDLHALDVGQGLAIVLRTRTHALVYDAGPSFRGGGSTGSLVVVPYLQRLGLRRLDLLAVSHADSDHAGGAADLADAVRIDALLAGEPLEGPGLAELPCSRGQTWHWDGVRFTVLYPAPAGERNGNNASCVIEIGTGNRAALLTGDIEIDAELALLRDRLAAPVDLVIVPHHGSRSSSHAGFVDALQAKVAIVSSGYANRWGLPREDVVNRWTARGALVLNTAVDGAVGYRLCPNDGPTSLGRERRDRRRIWMER